MPARTYIALNEKKAPSLKASKLRLILLLGSNAAGDFKLKPMLIYTAVNPRAFQRTSKSKLPVIWKANKRAWMTAELFEEWFRNHFVPAVEDYCSSKNFSFKALLLLDNAPCHPAALGDLYPNI